MEDSNILYYVVLGAIYFLSKMFGKKKKPEVTEETEEYEMPTPASPQQTTTPSFEDIFKELTGQSQSEYTPEEIKKPLEPAKPIPAAAPVLATELVDYQRKNYEALAPDDLIDIVPHKVLQRDKPTFARDENYAIQEDDDSLREGIRELLSDQEGLRKAFVIKEVLDRKY
jgi:hypothetical protein